MKTLVPILYRHAASDLIEPMGSAYAGRVPGRVWKNMNRQLLKLDAGRYFYPFDAMDAYAEAVNRVEEAAERIATGEIVLSKASSETYLTGVAYKAFYRFHLRKVQPQRELYRRIEHCETGRGTAGEDGFDIDNYDATQGAPSAKMCGAFDASPDTEAAGSPAMTIQQMAESLPGIPSARERREQAAFALEEIYAALERGPQSAEDDPRVARIAVRGFRAYVEADCDMTKAARLAGMSKTHFYRRWPLWVKLAQQVADHQSQITNH